jgi:hypothetical protein
MVAENGRGRDATFGPVPPQRDVRSRRAVVAGPAAGLSPNATPESIPVFAQIVQKSRGDCLIGRAECPGEPPGCLGHV